MGACLAFLAGLGIAGAASPGPGDWPAFRGPDRSGMAVEGRFPTHFGPQTNLAWQTPAPPGHSSPVVLGHRIFLTGYESNQLLVLAYDRDDGREQWRRSVAPGPIEQGSRLSHPATATPATDGDRVVSYFAPFGLLAHTPDGRELWRQPLPTPVTQHGASSSPVLAGGLVLQLCDQDTGSHLLAFDATSGQQVWRAERTAFRRGFSTPLPWPPAHPEVVLVAGTLRLVAYDLATGRERWSVEGFPNEMVASPIGADGTLFVAGWTSGSGVPRMPAWPDLAGGDADRDGQLTRDEAPPGPARQHFTYIDADKDGRLSQAEYEDIARIFDRSRNVVMAIRPGGAGDVTTTHVRWQKTRGLPYVPTPLHLDGRLYLIRNGGLSSCLDARSGDYLWREERLGALGDYYASPVAADGRILVISQPGTAVVLKAGPTLEVLARNPLGDEVLATPAISGDTLFVRTRTRLCAFREKEAVAESRDANQIPCP